MIEREIPPPSLTAGYHELPGLQAGGFTGLSRLLLSGLHEGQPPAVALTVLSARGVCYRAAGGWANLGYGTDVPVAARTHKDSRQPCWPSWQRLFLDRSATAT